MISLEFLEGYILEMNQDQYIDLVFKACGKAFISPLVKVVTSYNHYRGVKTDRLLRRADLDELFARGYRLDDYFGRIRSSISRPSTWFRGFPISEIEIGSSIATNDRRTEVTVSNRIPGLTILDVIPHFIVETTAIRKGNDGIGIGIELSDIDNGNKSSILVQDGQLQVLVGNQITPSIISKIFDSLQAYTAEAN